MRLHTSYTLHHIGCISICMATVIQATMSPNQSLRNGAALLRFVFPLVHIPKHSPMQASMESMYGNQPRKKTTQHLLKSMAEIIWAAARENELMTSGMKCCPCTALSSVIHTVLFWFTCLQYPLKCA